jgi:hypothetical protein
MQPRKHAKEIHAWAEGYTIQKLEKLCCDKSYQSWRDIDVAPMWHDDEEYRIKPVTKDKLNGS